MKKDRADPVVVKARKVFAASGLTLHALGVRMDYPKESARKSAWQLLNTTNDPKISMLRRFAKAMGIELKELLT